MYSFSAAQTRLVNRSNNLQKFLAQNQDIYNTVSPFAQEVSGLTENNSAVAELASAKGNNGKGYTADKNELKAEIVERISSVCTFASNYALSTGNNVLYNAVHYNRSDISRLRDAEVFSFVNNVVSAVTPVLLNPDFAGYPVTANDLDTLSEKVTIFSDNLGTGALQNAASRIASRTINAVLKDVQGNINSLNGMISYFNNSNPIFVKGYRDATIVNNTGIRHSGIKGIITNSNTEQPVVGVAITLQGKAKAKKATTDLYGGYNIEKFGFGKCKLTIAAQGYESKTVDIDILRGKTIVVNASLSSQVIKFKTA